MTAARLLIWPFRFIFALGLESSAHRLMESHQWRAARDAYGKLLEWSPCQATFHTESGLAHLMLNELEPAEDRLREAIRLDPQSLRAYDLLGVLLANQGRISEARGAWKSLIDASESLRARREWMYGRFARARIEEARVRLAALDSDDFAGFPVEPGYGEYPGEAPGSVD